jgi:hypothetical protein
MHGIEIYTPMLLENKHLNLLGEMGHVITCSTRNFNDRVKPLDGWMYYWRVAVIYGARK